MGVAGPPDRCSRGRGRELIPYFILENEKLWRGGTRRRLGKQPHQWHEGVCRGHGRRALGRVDSAPEAAAAPAALAAAANLKPWPLGA